MALLYNDIKLNMDKFVNGVIMGKFYYYPEEESELFDKKIQEFQKLKADNKSLEFSVVVNKEFVLRDDFEKKYKSISDVLNLFGISNDRISFSISTKDHYFSNEEWQKIVISKEKLQQDNIMFGFEDMTKTWTLEEVERANNSIMNSANRIKSQDYSPYEKLLSAYIKVTSRQYTKENANDHYSTSRSVYGVLNSDRIVCVGYSELLEAILHEIGDNNIKIYQNHVCCSRDNIKQDCTHRTLIVYLKDEKYGIDGYYYLDPTLDSLQNIKDIPKLTHFLVPISDIEKLNFHIRSNGKLIKKNGAKAKKSGNYNRHADISISWTSDDLEVTDQFLKDYAENNQNEYKTSISHKTRFPVEPQLKKQIFEASKPVSIQSTAKALFKILKTANPTSSEEELENDVNLTIQKNCDLAKMQYSKDCKNDFAKQNWELIKNEDFLNEI